MREKGLYGKDHGCTHRGSLSRSQTALVFQIHAKTFFSTLRDQLLHLLPSPSTDGVSCCNGSPQIAAEKLAVCSSFYHVAHKPRSIFDCLLAKDIVSGAGVSPRTASAVPGSERHQVHVLVQTRAQLQLMQVIQVTEKVSLIKPHFLSATSHT